MVEKEIVITNPTGLHTRPAKQVVDAAKTFKSEISLIKNDRKESAKSLIKIMKLGITSGNKIIVRCEGEDEEKALTSLVSIIQLLSE